MTLTASLAGLALALSPFFLVGSPASSPLPSPATATAAAGAHSAAGAARALLPTDGVWPLRPAPPEVARPFDPPLQTWSVGHRGVDLVGSMGQRVRSSLAGRVSFVGRIAGRGVVVVDHGEVRTTYEPVSATVHHGDSVTIGEPIGSVEMFGSHCLPRACLHWGLRHGEEYLDPLTLVGAAPGPVRLLPLWTGSAPVSSFRPGGVPVHTPGAVGPW